MFSIVIPTFNNYKYLKLCLESINKNSSYKHEIIIHSNDGSDGTLNYAKDNKFSRALIIEGASHFSPIRIENNLEGNNDIFKIRGEFIGADPKSVQDLSLRTLTAFINNLKNEESLKIFSNKTDINLDFHLLDRKTINEISKN